eukprot:scaffold9912_cov96-Isochrysis_galbana.AAC.6
MPLVVTHPALQKFGFPTGSRSLQQPDWPPTLHSRTSVKIVVRGTGLRSAQLDFPEGAQSQGARKPHSAASRPCTN